MNRFTSHSKKLTEMGMLDVVILNYNTKDLLSDCLDSLIALKNELDFRVIVVDNGSFDGSAEFIKNKYTKNKDIVILQTGENLGFAKGNNRARSLCKSKYVLFLNSDTIVKPGTLSECVAYLEKNKDVGALTCRVNLPNGNLDKDTRRSFITPWIGFTHIFLRADRLFPNSRIFAKYWYGYIPDTVEHEIDAIQGAFFMTSRKILDEVGWFDEDYFLDGEDIDLSWKIKNLSYKNIYYPKVSIIHLKGATKGKNNNRFNKGNISLKEKIRYKMAGVNSMEIFFRKRLAKNYSFITNIIVIVGIKLLKVVRYIKIVITG